MNIHVDRTVLELAAEKGESSLSEEERAHLARCPQCRAALSHTGPTVNERGAVAGQAPKTPRALTRGSAVGRYLILDLLGQGGMGSVYAAYDAELDRKVAIKVLRSDASRTITRDGQQRLMREAQAMARIAHPNVISVHDVGTVGDGVFLAMELVEGGTLKQWLREKERTPREILDAFVQAGRGLLAAHRAGLIHRDFKPDNVLVGTDGRVFVTDFGLARLASSEAPLASSADEDSDEALHPSALASALTRTGTVMGTPHYMSPEQHRGEPPDATSDQFSFCAALYWALFKQRAFDPQALAAAAALGRESSGSTASAGNGTESSPVREPPKDARISAAVRKAVMRGLSLSPSDRFPSLEPLLHVLEARPKRRAPLLGGAATTLALVAALGWAGVHARAERRSVCSGGPAKLLGAWDGKVRAAVEKAFRASGNPRAEQILGKLEQSLDHYASLWTGEFQDACAATAIRKEQPESVLSVRMVCLDRARAELQALTRLLSTVDSPLVDRSLQAVGQLDAPQDCADVAALSRPQPLPTDPARRTQIRGLQDQLSAAQALKLAGHFKETREEAQRLVTAAQPLEYPPLIAEALYLQASLMDESSAYADERRILVEAYDAADAGGADELRVQIASELIFVSSQALRFEDGIAWFHAAEAVLHRLGGHAALRSLVLNDVGTLYLSNHQFEEAARAFEKAIETLRPVPRANPVELANFQSNLARAYSHLGPSRLPDAQALIDASIATYLKAFDADNVALIDRYNSLSEVLFQQGKLDAAADAITHALQIDRRIRGEDDYGLANLYDSRATIYQAQGHYEEARSDYQAGLRVKQRYEAPDNGDFAYSYGGLGQCLVEEGRGSEAISYLEKALAIPLDDPGERGNSQFALARALWSARPAARARARALAAEAAASYRKAHDADSLARLQAWLAAPGAHPTGGATKSR